MSNPSKPDGVEATPAGDEEPAAPEADATAAAGDVGAETPPAETVPVPAPEAGPVPGTAPDTTADTTDAGQSEPVTVELDSEAVTEAITPEGGAPVESAPAEPERRFTAPGFDASETEVIPPLGEAQTEMLPGQPAGAAALIPGKPNRSWAWVLVLVFVILALAAVAVLGTLWLTKDSRAQASREEAVRTAIEDFDLAVQEGDLARLRTLTCGTVRDGYVNYNDDAWDDTYHRIAAAKQYPVVASIDEVVVNGDHAEANVTAFMAFAPQIRSTRSLDLQYRDDQWKICQTRGG